VFHRYPFYLLALTFGLGAAPTQAQVGKSQTFTFAKQDLGKTPKDWTADKTGKGEGSVWKIVADDTAPSKTGFALAQTSEGPKAIYNLCVAENTRFKDGAIGVAFKAVKGKEDQGGGIVWRYQDAGNYYVCRMNPLEDNFRVYKVVAGKRLQLATTKDDVHVPAGEWHTIKITMTGDKIECFLDGKKHLEARDDTFKDAGKVGLWTKADAQTAFDNLRLMPK
jgi:Domain of Unknown Function (DUF1080)